MENTSVHSLADEISPLTLAFVGDGDPDYYSFKPGESL